MKAIIRFAIFTLVIIGGLSIQPGSWQTAFAPGPVELLASSGDPSLAQPEATVTFLAVGDIMLSRHVAVSIERDDNPLLPFEQSNDLLSCTDFNFGNLETPISGNDAVKGHDLIFNTSTKHLAGLVSYNFKILNLANNHAMDQGVAGLENTRRVLSTQGISYLGVGSNQDEAWQPKVVTVNGVRIGFLGASYASTNDGDGRRNDYLARIEDLTELKNALTKLKSQADYVVVTMHAGIEYKRNPEPSQVTFAHAAIDYGADMVIGQHPHWIQTMEQYQGKYIFYSLGNFVFDQMGHEDTREGLTLRVVLQSQRRRNPASQDPIIQVRLAKIDLIPVIIQQVSPRPATDEETQRILQKIGVTSRVITGDN